MVNLGDLLRYGLRVWDAVYISWFGRAFTCGGKTLRGIYKNSYVYAPSFDGFLDSPYEMNIAVSSFVKYEDMPGELISLADGTKWKVVGGHSLDGNWSSKRWVVRCEKML